MEELIKLKQILVDYTYNNKVLLEVELNKISDKRLVIGLLVDILAKLEDYEADKDIITSTLLLFCDQTDSQKLWDCHEFFIGEMKKVFNKKALNKSLELLTILKDATINGEENPLEAPPFVKCIKDCSKDDIDLLNKFFLESEMYDVVVGIDKIIGN